MVLAAKECLGMSGKYPPHFIRNEIEINTLQSTEGECRQQLIQSVSIQ